MQLKTFSLLVICVLALAVPVLAHHSHGNYDASVWTEFEGTVREVHLINPHSWIYMDITDDTGERALWAMEAAGPDTIRRNGVTADDVKPGDTIQVRCHRQRDGGPGCLLGFVTPLHGDAARGHGVEMLWD